MRPVTSGVTCMPYTYIQFLRLPFQQSKLFLEKKKDHFLIHWVQEYVPVKASNWPAVGLKYFTALVATPSSGTVCTSAIWLLLNKDPSVWISDTWKSSRWLEIGFSCTTQKKKQQLQHPRQEQAFLIRGKWGPSQGSSTQSLCGRKNGLVVTQQDERSWELKSNFDCSEHFP